MQVKSMKLLVLGVHQNSEAYPNTRFRLQGLKQSDVFDVSEINFPMSRENLSSSRGFFGKIAAVARGILSHFVVISRYVFSAKTRFVYVPYPAVFVLYLLSWLPGRLRPDRIFTDAFISLYDTVVNDRALFLPESFAARLLFRMEKRAYSLSTKIIVDTPQSARFLCKLFSLHETKVVAVPLSTDEHNFQPVAYFGDPNGHCRVLFVGTLVPLHGIETILEAAVILSVRKDIVFRIVGDGQEARKIEMWKSRHAIPLQWVREWQSSEEVAREIVHSDICLGIFGSGDKTQRVCPFKIYAYASVGRAIITGESDWTKDIAEHAGEHYLETVPVANARALADKIARLADDVNLRKSLAAGSRKFYEENLSNKIANEQLTSCILSS